MDGQVDWVACDSMTAPLLAKAPSLPGSYIDYAYHCVPVGMIKPACT
jgi:hypothetical protein